VKRLLNLLDRDGADPVVELQRATRNMLANSWGCERADLGLLAAKINSWLSPPTAKSATRGNFTAAPTPDASELDRLAQRF
jgi:hypothetical protein